MGFRIGGVRLGLGISGRLIIAIGCCRIGLWTGGRAIVGEGFHENL